MAVSRLAGAVEGMPRLLLRLEGAALALGAVYLYQRIGEITSEAALVVTSLGDPGEPARVLANRSAARPGAEVRIADLETCLREPMQEEAV